MENNEEKEEKGVILSYLQNHEKRLTVLEMTQDTLETELRELKEIISRGNEDQTKKLDEINSRLFDEFINKVRISHSERWKLLGIISSTAIGGGGILYVIAEKLLGG